MGITTDLLDHNNVERVAASRAYAARVTDAGGLPILLHPDELLVPDVLKRCDAFVLTGGDDPVTEPFGEPTHSEAVRVKPARQAFETALLHALESARPEAPVLGVCLGMQMMALIAGGRLDQHMPDSIGEDAARAHWNAEHAIGPEPGCSLLAGGRSHSKHRQRIEDPGSLRVAARAHDGVIEAVYDPGRPFYLGVQWHPERTGEVTLGAALFERLLQSV